MLLQQTFLKTAELKLSVAFGSSNGPLLVLYLSKFYFKTVLQFLKNLYLFLGILASKFS
jgi:hypothetical protein